jgi:D-arabinose 1-dehydrogenase-like Zn-dependent alcohol dehydrogenase
VEGHYSYCPFKKEFGSQASDQGSFARGAVWKEPLLYKLPDALPSDVAAPLMCAGITVYGPLVEFGVKSSDVVGVVGIGGLGHLAIQFANKMGCEVIALSQTDSKKEEATKLGAHHFIATKGVAELSSPKKINHLLVTTSQMPNWTQYAPILHLRVQVFPLTVTDSNTSLSFNYMRFLTNGWRMIGSVGAPKIVFAQMLEFATLHGIKPIIEKFPLNKQGIIDAMQKLDDGKMRYRGVLYASKA